MPELLVSSPGAEGGIGGVLLVTERGCEQLDGLPTTGLALSPDRRCVARLVWTEGPIDDARLVISDERGLVVHRRVPVREPHSVLWRDDGVVAVSTFDDAVVVLSEAGEAIRVHSPVDGARGGDRWHINSLAERDGRLVASCFGIFDLPRGWAQPGACDGAGMVFDLESGAPLVRGLSAPHDPTWVGDGWIICNSLTGEIVRTDRVGRTARTVTVGGWPRGVAVHGRRAYVGVGAHRDGPSLERASLVCVDVDRLAVLGRVPLPVRDVFSVRLAGDAAIRGLRLLADEWSRWAPVPITLDDPLPADESRARVQLAGPHAGGAAVTIEVTNLSARAFSSRGRHPVRIGLRVEDPAEGWSDVGRVDLPGTLPGGRSALVAVPVDVASPGAHVFIGVVQEQVRWFTGEEASLVLRR